MKKFFALLTTLLLAAAAPLAAMAEDTTLIPFEGLVTEVFDGGFLMEDKHMGTLQVNTDENTVLDGILSIQPIEVGMYVIVDHNGMMTRSLPPQVYGLRVGCYTLNGTADQISEEGVLLTGDPIFGDVFVQMTPTMTNVFPGTPMLVYYDGVMTMSLPGKVNARYVVVPQLTGVVSEKDGAGFTLTDVDGNVYRVLTSDSLLVGQLLENEEEAIVEEAVTETGEAVAGEEAAAVEETGTEAGEAAEGDVAGGEAAAETADGDVASEEAADGDAAGEEATAETADGDANDEVAAAEAAENGAAAGETVEGDTADAATAEDTAAPTPADGLLLDETIPTAGSAEAAPEAAILWGDGDTVTVYHQGPIDAQPGSDLLALGVLVHR